MTSNPEETSVGVAKGHDMPSQIVTHEVAEQEISQALSALNLSSPQPQILFPSATSFPFELLSAIFEYACANVGKSPRAGRQAIDRKCRNAIVSTCQRWREVALCTSSLWDRILASKQGDLLQPPLAALKLEVERSASRPIWFRIQGDGDSTQWYDLLQGASSQCESLYIQDVDPYLLARTLHPSPDGNHGAPSTWPALRTLVLDSIPRTRLLGFAILDLTDCPNLDELSLHGLNVRVLLPPANHLRRLSLYASNNTKDDILLIRQCHKLQELKWHVVVKRIGSSEHTDIALPDLHTLSLSLQPQHGSDDAGPLVRSLRAPNLRTLALLSIPVIPPDHFPKLERLILEFASPSMGVVPMLHRVPTIRELIFDRHLGYCREDFARELTKSNPHGGFKLLPALEELSITIYEVDWVEALLQARNLGHPEGRGMPFVLHIGWEYIDDPEFRRRHPWSLDDKDKYVDPFRSETWSIIQV